MLKISSHSTFLPVLTSLLLAWVQGFYTIRLVCKFTYQIFWRADKLHHKVEKQLFAESHRRRGIAEAGCLPGSAQGCRWVHKPCDFWVWLLCVALVVGKSKFQAWNDVLKIRQTWPPRWFYLSPVMWKQPRRMLVCRGAGVQPGGCWLGY